MNDIDFVLKCQEICVNALTVWGIVYIILRTLIFIGKSKL